MGLFDWFKKSSSPEPKGHLGENRLEVVLKKAASEPAYRPEFYKLLLFEELVVLIKEDQLPEGEYTLEEGTSINIATLNDGKIPVFTSTNRIFDKGVITSEVPFLAMKGDELFTLTKGATLVLNPYSDYGKELLPAEIESMLDGTVLSAKHQKLTIQKETQVLIGQPAVYPQKIVDSLKVLFSEKVSVKAAYLGWIHDPASTDPAHLIIGLDMRTSDQSVINEAGFIAYSHLPSHEFLDFIQIKDGGPIASYFLKSTTPFYTRN